MIGEKIAECMVHFFTITILLPKKGEDKKASSQKSGD
jgi:hypothetical protein